jgi:hypothetical protein
MAKIIVHLGEQGFNAPQQLAHREIRLPHAQVAPIIRQELVRQGMIPDETKTQEAAFPQGPETGGAS